MKISKALENPFQAKKDKLIVVNREKSPFRPSARTSNNDLIIWLNSQKGNKSEKPRDERVE